jgi:hypothetical protein
MLGDKFASAGEFSLTNLASNRVLIEIPGKTSDDGILLVTSNEIASNDGGITNGPDDNFYVQEYDDVLGGFVVGAYDLTGASDEGSGIFNFAFIEFDNPISLDDSPPVGLIGDANGDERVDREDAAIVLRNLGLASGATFSDGDFDDDGAVTLVDVALLQNHYGEELNPSPQASSVPEPGGFMLLALAAGTCFLRSPRRPKSKKMFSQIRGREE